MEKIEMTTEELRTFTRGYKLNERKLICVSLTFTWGCKTELLAVTKMIAPRDIGEQWEFYCADGQVYRCWAESIVDMVVTV